MILRKSISLLLFLVAFSFVKAQEIPVSYSLGENNSDRYKYSTVLSISGSNSDQTVIVRTYYGGMPLRPKGHFVEMYDADLNLIEDYNNKYAGQYMVDGFIKNGQLYLLELKYNEDELAYQYVVHHSPLGEFNFTERKLLSVPSKEVLNPLAVNKYNRKFGNGFSTAVHFNKEKSAFAITVQHRAGKKEKYTMYLFGTDLKQQLEYDFTAQTEEKNYAFENIEVSKDLQTLYFMGKAFFKKRRFDVCAKLNASGTMEWARNINKAEVTEGDEAYASYTAYGQGEDMYFFINSGENPQKLGKDRIIFKQGYSRNPNLFVIRIDASGNLSHQKLIDDKEVRLPIMVSRPLINAASDQLFFYAKRGTKKQLIQVSVGSTSGTPSK